MPLARPPARPKHLPAPHHPFEWAGVDARDGAKHSLVAAGAAYIVSHPPMAADREARLAIKAAVSIVA